MAPAIGIKVSSSLSNSSPSSHNLLPLSDGMPVTTGVNGDSQPSAMMCCYPCTPPSALFWQRTKATKSDDDDGGLEKVASSGGGRWSIQIQNWRETLLQVSNIASILCVIDCTVLPIVTLLFPLLGWASSASTSELLHQVGHAVARYFVLPVGTLTTALNFWAKGNNSNNNEVDQKTRWAKLGLFLLGLTGCLLVAVANGGDMHNHGHHHNHDTHDNHHGGHDHHVHSITMLYRLQHGMGHRVTNLVGCACLLTSNYLSRRLHAHNDNCCNHKH